jgi:hypothetical protein
VVERTTAGAREFVAITSNAEASNLLTEVFFIPVANSIAINSKFFQRVSIKPGPRACTSVVLVKKNLIFGIIIVCPTSNQPVM